MLCQITGLAESSLPVSHQVHFLTSVYSHVFCQITGCAGSNFTLSALLRFLISVNSHMVWQTTAMLIDIGLCVDNINIYALYYLPCVI